MGSPELFPATAMEIAATPTKPPATASVFELLSTVSVVCKGGESRERIAEEA